MPQFYEIVNKWDLRLREALTGYQNVKGDQAMEQLYHEKADLIDRFLHDLDRLKLTYED